MLKPRDKASCTVGCGSKRKRRGRAVTGESGQIAGCMVVSIQVTDCGLTSIYLPARGVRPQSQPSRPLSFEGGTWRWKDSSSRVICSLVLTSMADISACEEDHDAQWKIPRGLTDIPVFHLHPDCLRLAVWASTGPEMAAIFSAIYIFSHVI